MAAPRPPRRPPGDLRGRPPASRSPRRCGSRRRPRRAWPAPRAPRGSAARRRRRPFARARLRRAAAATAARPRAPPRPSHGRHELDAEALLPLPPACAGLEGERDKPRVVVSVAEDPRLAAGLAGARRATLVDRHVRATLEQLVRGRQPDDPRSDDGDAHRSRWSVAVRSAADAPSSARYHTRSAASGARRTWARSASSSPSSSTRVLEPGLVRAGAVTGGGGPSLDLAQQVAMLERQLGERVRGTHTGARPAARPARAAAARAGCAPGARARARRAAPARARRGRRSGGRRCPSRRRPRVRPPPSSPPRPRARRTAAAPRPGRARGCARRRPARSAAARPPEARQVSSPPGRPLRAGPCDAQWRS